MKKLIYILALTSPFICHAEEYNFSGDFNSQFTDIGDGTGVFQQKAGRAIYHNNDVTGTENNEGFFWDSVQPRADQSWILSADVTIPLLAKRTFAPGGLDFQIYAEAGIACLFGDFSFAIGLQQGFQGDSTKRIILAENWANGVELFDPFPDENGIGEVLTGQESARVTISYNATNHTLSAVVGGPTLFVVGETTLFSVDIEDSDSASGSINQTDWGMVASDTFKIAIFGSSENYPVNGVRPAQIDNLHFSLVEAGNPPMSLSISQDAIELNLDNSANTSPVEIHTSSDLSDWYTIHTVFDNGKIYLPKDNGSQFFRAVNTTP